MSHTNFLGIPVEGDIVHTSSQRAPQRPIEELQPVLEELIANENFEGLRWRQYTPYFNDGDPCVFGVRGVYGRVVGLPPLTKDEEEHSWEEEDGFWSIPNTYEKAPEITAVLGLAHGRTYNRGTGKYDREEGWLVEPRDPELLHAMGKAIEMIDSGAFNDALLKLFGDHAIITLRRDKIEVESYEHE